MTRNDLDAQAVRTPAEMFDLTGRICIVTGASSGLGQRFARVLAHSGAQVIAVARRADRLTALDDAHDNIHSHPADVTDEAMMSALVDETVSRYGRIDALVNNAGAGNPSPATQEPLEDFRRSLELNLVAVFNLARMVAVPMLAAGKGSIINIASIYGLRSSWPIPNNSYTASKGAVVNLTRELGCQWADAGVRVNAIAPGFFPSESTVGMEDPSSARFIRRRTPMRRMGIPHELDGTLVYLASDASSFVTGQTLAVDGGWTSY
ncbi:SDR family NAD(P)-dependent oxidoreductase [Mycobacterium sp. MMS18-G62]